VSARGKPERQPKVACPHCAYFDSLVCDGFSEPDDDGTGKYRTVYIRRRRCQRCERHFHTVERLLILPSAKIGDI
jgi:transcriptional regulator NrdR family protein